MSEYQSWGRYPHADQKGIMLDTRYDLVPELSSWLPYGNGRSYGDSCLNHNGVVVSTKKLSHFISFDEKSGVLCCESGVLLKSILELMIPRGWICPVLPGTQFVSVGGAIANDIHGKNHHVMGSFGQFVLCFELLRSNGDRLICSANENSEYFYATIGGLGLTGLVTWVQLQLVPVSSNALLQENIKFDVLDDFFELSQESKEDYAYSVAWIDCLAQGKGLGRGHFTRANHYHSDYLSTKAQTLSFPVDPPFSFVNQLSLKLFNTFYFHRQCVKKKTRIVNYQPFFFPLDRIGNWNRMYGRSGFLQYQCVLPTEYSKQGIKEILNRISFEKKGSFLAVLKMFGDSQSLGYISYPMEGANLALDFPNEGEKTLALLRALDKIVMDCGGRLYPAKDSRMSAEHFQSFYPKWSELENLRDKSITSSF